MTDMSNVKGSSQEEKSLDEKSNLTPLLGSKAGHQSAQEDEMSMDSASKLELDQTEQSARDDEMSTNSPSKLELDQVEQSAREDEMSTKTASNLESNLSTSSPSSRQLLRTAILRNRRKRRPG